MQRQPFRCCSRLSNSAEASPSNAGAYVLRREQVPFNQALDGAAKKGRGNSEGGEGEEIGREHRGSSSENAARKRRGEIKGTTVVSPRNRIGEHVFTIFRRKSLRPRGRGRKGADMLWEDKERALEGHERKRSY